MLHDLRFALRALRKTPGFTLAASAILALGIGASTALFSFLSGILLAPLPWPDADELVVLSKGNPALSFEGMSLASAELEQLARASDQIEAVSGYGWKSVDLMTDEGARPLTGFEMRPGLLEILGRQPPVGRSFLPEDFEPGSPEIALLSHDLWQSDFGGDPEVVGRTLRLAGGEVEIAGVLPAGPVMPIFEADVFLPARWSENDRTNRSAGTYAMGIGRLVPGADLELAHRDLAQALAALEAEQPSGMDGWVPEITLLSERIVGDTRQALHVLFGAVLVVLLMACVNVAGLLLVRGSGRLGELTIRRALGATRGLVFRQLVVENLLLALLGCGGGLVLATGLRRVLLVLAPESLPRLAEVTFDGRVALFAVVATLASALAFGVLPALTSVRTARFSRSGTGAALATDTRLREALTVAQMALAMMLLVCAGLLTKNLVTLLSTDPGIDTAGALRAIVRVPTTAYPEGTDQSQLLTELTEHVKAAPGITSAAATSWIPLSGAWAKTGLTIDGFDGPADDPDLFAFAWRVTPEIFEALGVPLLQGRGLTSAAGDRAAPVAVITRKMAERFWPGQDPLGGRFRITSNDDTPWTRVVGVAADLKTTQLTDGPSIGYWTLFSPDDQPLVAFELIARGSGDVDDLAGTLSTAIREFDPRLSLGSVDGLDGLIQRHVERPRFHLAVVGTLGLIALILAFFGVYAVVSYATAHRSREVAVRVALGARPLEVVALLGRRGTAVLVLGTVVGAALAASVARTLDSLLVGVQSLDAATFGLVGAALIGAGLIAVLIPARRASTREPASALRSAE